MSLPVYSTGTVAVAAAGTIVTLAGGIWSGINARQGDFISIAGSTAVLITEVTDATHLKIAPWPGAAQTAAAYQIFQNYVGRVVGVAAAEDVGVMLEKLHVDGLPFIVGSDEAAPDPSYGDDGQLAFKPTTGQWWVKEGGVWIPSAGLSSGDPLLDFETVDDAINSFIPAGANSVRTRGYASGADGGAALYKRAASAPAHPGKFQNTNGSWWELAEAVVRPQMFGGIADGTTIADTFGQAAVDYLKAKGAGGTLDLSGNWAIQYGLAFVGINNLTIQSRGGRIHYLQAPEAWHHLLRISGSDQVNIDGLDIWSDAGLVRNDTGFAIQITTSSDITISNCRFTNTASNPVWIDNSSDIVIAGNKVDGSKAGGIQLSNNCEYFSITDNSVQDVNDDAIGVVRDTAEPGPKHGTIVGNVIGNVLYGHGIVLISCDDVVVSANMIAGTAAAGIGNYLWTGASTLATQLMITDNQISLSGQAPANPDNVCSILIAGASDSIVSGNVLDNASGTGFAAELALIRAVIFDKLTIKDNLLKNCANYGIHVPSGGSNVGALTIDNNLFSNIQMSPIRCRPTATGTGTIAIVNNTFSLSGYMTPGATHNIIDVANMGANRIYIGGNKQIDQNYTINIDTATCSNFFATDNAPPAIIAYTPTVSVFGTGSFTPTSPTGKYYRSGGNVYFYSSFGISAASPPGNFQITLPVAAISGAPSFINFTENALTGIYGMMEFLTATSVYNRVVLNMAAGQTVVVSGWYGASG
jgi:parallel beta-helix repeat protein